MKKLLAEIKSCQVCSSFLDHGTRPIVSASRQSKIAIIGQAPGRIVHNTGVPWDDKSGNRLRNWLGVDKDVFYDNTLFAIVPMGFCYPGKGKTGDLPPRPECAPLWHHQLLSAMPDIALTLLIGSYAQQYYLGESKKKTLTETVKSFEQYLPNTLPLPHPSPRNNIWIKKNPWFEAEVLPMLKNHVARLR